MAKPIFFLNPNESIDHAIKRISKQIAQNCQTINQNKEDLRGEDIHQVRLCLKRMRSLLRLIKPEYSKLYAIQNKKIKMASSFLAPYRDHSIIRETLKNYLNTISDQNIHFEIKKLLEKLNLPFYTDIKIMWAIAYANYQIEQTAQSITNFTFKQTGFDLIQTSLFDSYKKTYSLFNSVKQNHEIFHEWRKNIKYFTYHIELIVPLNPSKLYPLYSKLKKTGSCLGESHDLFIVLEWIDQQIKNLKILSPLGKLIYIILSHDSDLKKDALNHGNKIFDKKPKKWMSSIHNSILSL